MKKFLFTSALVSALTFPLLASAQGTFQSILVMFGNLVNTAIPFALALGFLAFFWGLALFLFSVGSDEGRKKGGMIMLWGIIAIFVIVSIAGIVQVIQGSLGVASGGGGFNAPIIQ